MDYQALARAEAAIRKRYVPTGDGRYFNESLGLIDEAEFELAFATDLLEAAFDEELGTLDEAERDYGEGDEDEEAVELMRIHVRPKPRPVTSMNAVPVPYDDGGYATFCILSNGMVVRERYHEGKQKRTFMGGVKTKGVAEKVRALTTAARAIAGGDDKIMDISLVGESVLDEADSQDDYDRYFKLGWAAAKKDPKREGTKALAAWRKLPNRNKVGDQDFTEGYKAYIDTQAGAYANTGAKRAKKLGLSEDAIEEAPLDAAIVKAMKRRARPASVTDVYGMMDAPTRDTHAAMSRLLKAGKLIRTASGGKTTYKLGEGVDEMRAGMPSGGHGNLKVPTVKTMKSKAFAKALVKARSAAVHSLLTTNGHVERGRADVSGVDDKGGAEDEMTSLTQKGYAATRSLIAGYIALSLDQGANIAQQATKQLSIGDVLTIGNNIRAVRRFVAVDRVQDNVREDVDEGADRAKEMGIQSPNSSGQGSHPDHKKNPHHATLTSAGFDYSHTTPVGHSGDDFRLHHTYRLNPKFAVSVYPNGKGGWTWEGGVSGGGRRQMGSGDPALAKYIKGAKKRHKMTEDDDPIEEVVKLDRKAVQEKAEALSINARTVNGAVTSAITTVMEGWPYSNPRAAISAAERALSSSASKISEDDSLLAMLATYVVGKAGEARKKSSYSLTGEGVDEGVIDTKHRHMMAGKKTVVSDDDMDALEKMPNSDNLASVPNPTRMGTKDKYLAYFTDKVKGGDPKKQRRYQESQLDEVDPITAIGALGAVAVGTGVGIGVVKAIRSIQSLLRLGKKSAAETALERMNTKDRKAIDAFLKKETRKLQASDDTDTVSVGDGIDEAERKPFSDLAVGDRFAKPGRDTAFVKSSKNAAKILNHKGEATGKPSRQKPHEEVVVLPSDATPGNAVRKALGYESVEEGKGTVRITVKKIDGEWAAAYHLNGKFQEGPTYYAGDDKADAVSTAKAMKKRAKAAGFTVQECELDESMLGVPHDDLQTGFAYRFTPGSKKPKRLKNLGWLLRNWQEVSSFTVEKYEGDASMVDAVLIAHLDNGAMFATTYASKSVLKGFLNRPVFKGLSVRWFGVHQTIGEGEEWDLGLGFTAAIEEGEEWECELTRVDCAVDETVSALQKDTAKLLKKFFGSKGLKVGIRSSSTQSEYMAVRLTQFGEFPVEMRRDALRAIYGDSFKIGEQAVAGNVMKEQMSLGAEEWRTFLQAQGVKVAAFAESDDEEWVPDDLDEAKRKPKADAGLDLKKFERMGAAAFKAGKMATPAHDAKLMGAIAKLSKGKPVGYSVAILDAWSRGWHVANANAPVESRVEVEEGKLPRRPDPEDADYKKKKRPSVMVRKDGTVATDSKPHKKSMTDAERSRENRDLFQSSKGQLVWVDADRVKGGKISEVECYVERIYAAQAGLDEDDLDEFTSGGVPSTGARGHVMVDLEDIYGEDDEDADEPELDEDAANAHGLVFDEFALLAMWEEEAEATRGTFAEWRALHFTEVSEDEWVEDAPLLDEDDDEDLDEGKAAAPPAGTKTHKGIYYFHLRRDAQLWAEENGWPTDRINDFTRGFAVQAGKSGNYAGPGAKPRPFGSKNEDVEDGRGRTFTESELATLWKAKSPDYDIEYDDWRALHFTETSEGEFEPDDMLCTLDEAETECALDEDELDEVSPPGFRGTVKAMKRKHPEIDNPYALAWSMFNKGAKSHRKADGTRKDEGDDGPPYVSKVTGASYPDAKTRDRMEALAVASAEKKKLKRKQARGKKKRNEDDELEGVDLEGVDEASDPAAAIRKVLLQNDTQSFNVKQLAMATNTTEQVARKAVNKLVIDGTAKFKRGDGYSLAGTTQAKGLRVTPGDRAAGRGMRIKDRRTIDRSGRDYFGTERRRRMAEDEDEDPLDDLYETTTSGGVGGFSRAPLGQPVNKGREGGIRDDAKGRKGRKAEFAGPGGIKSEHGLTVAMREAIEAVRATPGVITSADEAATDAGEPIYVLVSMGEAEEVEVVFAEESKLGEYDSEEVDWHCAYATNENDEPEEARVSSDDQTIEVSYDGRRKKYVVHDELYNESLYDDIGAAHGSALARATEGGYMLVVQSVKPGDAVPDATVAEGGPEGGQNQNTEGMIEVQFNEDELERFVLAAQTAGVDSTAPIDYDGGTFRTQLPISAAERVRELMTA